MTPQPADRRKLQFSLRYARFMTGLNAALTVFLLYRLLLGGAGRDLGAVAVTLIVGGITVVGGVYSVRIKRRLEAP